MWLTKSQIYNTSSGFDTQTLDAMKKLHDKILTFGGDEVCMTMFDERLCREQHITIGEVTQHG